jgi:glycosyltransferase involved in cell wall biosynthesis
MKKKKVYLIGSIYGQNRTQNLVKFLLDQEFKFYHNSFYSGIFQNKTGAKRLLRIVLRIIDAIIQMPAKVYNIMLADYVVLPAMARNNQLELRIAHFLNKYIVTDFYISLYDTLVQDRKTINEGSSQARNLFKQDKISIDLANKIMFLNDAEKSFYLNLLGIKHNAEKHKIVPLCIEKKEACELNYFNSEEKNGIFNVCWWGTYIPLHGLDKIIYAADFLRNKYNLKFHFHLFGNDENESKTYKNLIKDLNLEHIVSIHNDMTFANGKLEPFLTKYCSLVLGNFGDSEKAKYVIGNKLIEGIAMRAPVLTGESIALGEFFDENDIFYSQNNAEHIADKLYEISQSSREKIKTRIEKSSLIYETHFSPKAFNNHLTEIFHS